MNTPIFDLRLPRPTALSASKIWFTPPKLDLQYANNNAFCYIFDCFYAFSVVIVTVRANFMINKVVKDKVVLPKAQPYGQFTSLFCRRQLRNVPRDL